VAQVKQAIESARSDFPAAHQKLILTGKVLKDEQSIQELGITDKNFLVCVVTKVWATNVRIPVVFSLQHSPVLKYSSSCVVSNAGFLAAKDSRSSSCACSSSSRGSSCGCSGSCSDAHPATSRCSSSATTSRRHCSGH
jgi:hypothetical protein